MQAHSQHTAISLWLLHLAAALVTHCGCAGFQPRLQPVRHWPGALRKEHVGYRLVVISSFSRLLFSDGKSLLGELESRQGTELSFEALNLRGRVDRISQRC